MKTKQLLSIFFLILFIALLCSSTSSMAYERQTIAIKVHELKNGDAIEIRGEKNIESLLFIDVPDGAYDLTIAISNESNNIFGYIRFNTLPTKKAYHHFLVDTTHSRKVTIENPQAERYYILILNEINDFKVTVSASYIQRSIPDPPYTLNTRPFENYVTLDPPGGVYEKGTRVTLTASGKPYESFLYWNGDVEGPINPLTITMNSDKNIYPQFNAPMDITCQYFCGEKNPYNNCWCDNTCEQYGDCCSDKDLYCRP